MINVSDRLSRLVHLPGHLSAASDRIPELLREAQVGTLLLGKLAANQAKALGPRRPLAEAEFRVYSQWGDDGIIQYLISQVPLPSSTFIEFGVEDYSESNTLFLLQNDNWRGLIMDGSTEHMERVRGRDLYWRHDLTALNAFITRENINQLIGGAGFAGPVGLLSIDIDGNDYWVWQALDVVDPAIVIVEYNSVFGPTKAVSVPYDPEFRRAAAHNSHLFWGCSVAALCHLAASKGYVFVGCNSNGNNAYFVKRELADNLTSLSPEQGYVLSRFRESRGPDGRLTYLSGDERFAAIAEMTVTDVKSNLPVRLRDA